ncbi:Outer membrane protein OmpA [Belliella pelovolcani]|uniref:Outer membrane protein OmpA n=2 Tax=Belliella pelovolcani TaxID=529505 RepID=A0A1N7Q0F9_9BACT|nr:Outer membrane protein OmpA [Belliella pelovolcani]
MNKYIFGASSFLLLAFSFSTSLIGQEISSLTSINTPYDEQHPVISPNGELFFSVGFHPENLGGATDFGDIWMAKQATSGAWEKPMHVKSLSTSGNDVLLGFPDALTAYVYHSGDGIKMRQGIHQYARFGSEWNYVRPLEMGNFRNQGTHFSGRLSQDKKVIIMAMNSFGSYGNEDIYISEEIREGVWSSPINLGSDVNTFSQELTPSISSDLKRIYFASNSNISGRGRDIYTAQRLDADSWTSWSEPEPLGQINTEGAELSYVIFDQDKSLAFYTSTQNSEGFGDILMITHQQENWESVAKVLDKVDDGKDLKINQLEVSNDSIIDKESLSKASTVVVGDTQAIIPVDSIKPVIVEEIKPEKQRFLKVIDQQTKEILPFTLVYTNAQGFKKTAANQEELWAALDAGQVVSFSVSSENYIPSLVADPNSIDNELIIALQPLASGSTIVLDNIQFNRGTSDFADAKSISQLDELVDFLRGNANVRIRLEGHTDNVGDPQLNKELSMQRASKIRGYLTLKGIDFERIRIAGWGGSRPVADNATEDGKAQNRRVEMIIDRLN